jgi:hypothetical protein
MYPAKITIAELEFSVTATPIASTTVAAVDEFGSALS